VAVVVALAVFAYSRIHPSGAAVMVALAIFASSPHSLNRSEFCRNRTILNRFT